MLVLCGGVFAGLTLGLMGQDEVNLQVIEASGEGSEQKHAKKVLKLLKRGKHWVLVTLLLSNVITNETLPIVLDRSLGGGWPAVVSSTVLIVIFGEIIPQSLCVRYGLAIGAWFTPFVLALMYLMYPVAYPTALLLDHILGEEHGTMYKKAGLKSLVTLHRTMGIERLNQDEVTIISAVLDLKEKTVGSIMTPIEDTYTMSTEKILDEKAMDEISARGYSRIPIYRPEEAHNFVGMLLVKTLITYDPEDAKPVSEFPLATLPETAPSTSALDILNFFQEGKSHMVLVSEDPGENHGALGVLTLEDVVEELIGEEIVDESDVYIDVHKAIRRLNPGPFARNALSTAQGFTPRVGTPPIPSRPDSLDRKRTMPHLGPSNLAANPRPTTRKNVTIKGAGGQTDDLFVDVEEEGSSKTMNYGSCLPVEGPDLLHASTSPGRTFGFKESLKNHKIVIETERASSDDDFSETDGNTEAVPLLATNSPNSQHLNSNIHASRRSQNRG